MLTSTSGRILVPVSYSLLSIILKQLISLLRYEKEEVTFVQYGIIHLVCTQNFSKNQIFLSRAYQGQEMLVFRKILRRY